jgi:transcriptional regulator with XRE-family HTH domain
MISTDFGARVRAAREAAGLSQAEVARQVGINRVYYSLLEAGRYVADADETKRLVLLLFKRDIASDRGSNAGARSDADQTAGALLDDEKTEHDCSEASDANNRISAANAALDSLRDMGPPLAESRRAIELISTADTALRRLDYSELQELCKKRGVSTEGLATKNDFALLKSDEMVVCESRATASLLCAAMYRDAWRTTSFENLKQTESALRGRLPQAVALDYRKRSLLEILFTDEADACAKRRADLAPYVVMAALQRTPIDLAD